MNRKQIFLLLLSLGFCTLAVAQAVSSEVARQRAAAFFQAKGRSLDGNMGGQHRWKSPQVDAVNSPLYVFNAEHGTGFVVISGDERTDEVLGYTESGTFDADHLPANLHAWLQGYADQISALGAHAAPARSQVVLHAAIAPLVNSAWGQGDPYNLQCPEIGGERCVTGCVATAMAQVMRYNQWPQAYTATIPSYTVNETVGTLTALPAVKFNWSNMLCTYADGANSTQLQAIGQLMRYCGQAVEMNYGLDASGASAYSVAAAMRNYFGYDLNTRIEERDGYTAKTWDDLIYRELQSRRPVIYSGLSTVGRHAFVCDGYDGNGFYHINWGWEGAGDGYFKLSVMNPYADSDGFAMEQSAVVGIQKPTSFTEDLRMLSLYTLTHNGNNVQAVYLNMTGASGTFDYGFAIQKKGEEDEGYWLPSKTATMEAFEYDAVGYDIGNLPALEVGETYVVYPYSKVNGAGWYRIWGDDQLFMEVTKTEDDYQFTYHPRASLWVDDPQLVGNAVAGMPQEVRFTIENTGEEFNNKVYLFASQTDDKGAYVGRTNVVVEADETEDVSLYFTPDAAGTWHLWLSTDETGATNCIGPKDVSIKAQPVGASKLQVTGHEITPGELTTVNVSIKNNSTEGYYLPVFCNLYPESGGLPIASQASANMNLEAGTTASVQFQFDGLAEGRSYFAALLCYTDHVNNNLDWLGDNMPFTYSATAPAEDTDISQLDNVVYINRTETYVGTKTTLSVRMKNTAAIEGFQFDLCLPEGISVATDADGFAEVALSTERTTARKTNGFDAAFQPDGTLRVLAYSTNGSVISGNDGEVVTVGIELGSAVAAGHYPIVLRNIVLSDVNAASYQAGPVKTTLVVNDFRPGDANGNGQVDVADLTTIAHHIMGRTPAEFVAKAADANNDGKIDVADLTATSHLILYGTVAAARAARSATVEATDLAQLDNVVYIEPVQASCGERLSLSVRLKNTVAVEGFQFDLYLPEGAHFVLDADGYPDATLSTERTTSRKTNGFDAAIQPDGALRVLAYSTNGSAISGNDGEVARVNIQLDDDMAEGSYALKLRAIVVSDVEAHGHATSQVDSLITVSAQSAISHIGTLAPGHARFHNLQGQRLTAPQQGVNIVEGRKVVMGR